MLGKKDLRKMAQEIGAELKYVTFLKRPDGGSSVCITRNNGRNVMYLVNYAAGKRIRKTIKRGSDAYYDTVRNIVLQIKSDILNDNYKAIVSAGKSFSDYDDREVMKRTHEKYPNLEHEAIIRALDEISERKYSEWALQPYEQFDYMEEKKIHTTSRGLKVRSKSELALCELFYELGIEFRYEEKIILGGKAFGPDFTIRRKSDGKIFYWEHCGMMDQPNYRKKNAEKLAAYEEFGIVPWDNLIVTYDKDGSIDLSIAEAIVRSVLMV